MFVTDAGGPIYMAWSPDSQSLGLLVEDMGERLAALSKAAGERDGAELARVAHAMKGAAANAAAEGVRRVAAAMEERGRAAEWDGLEAGMAELRAEVDRCARCAKSILAGNGAGVRREERDAIAAPRSRRRLISERQVKVPS